MYSTTKDLKLKKVGDVVHYLNGDMCVPAIVNGRHEGTRILDLVLFIVEHPPGEVVPRLAARVAEEYKVSNWDKYHEHGRWHAALNCTN